MAIDPDVELNDTVDAADLESWQSSNPESVQATDDLVAASEARRRARIAQN